MEAKSSNDPREGMVPICGKGLEVLLSSIQAQDAL